MKKKYQFPRYLGITGQSGAGKGTVIKKICQFYEENKISYELISGGALFAKEASEDTLFGKAMAQIHNAGLPQPLMVTMGIYFPIIKKAINEGKCIIHDGSPRISGDAQMLAGMLNAGYFETVKVLEVWANNETCFKRLSQRTTEDRRLDLSIEGNPGKPDIEKIKAKMLWWSKNRDIVMLEIKSLNLDFCIIKNNEKISGLDKSIKNMFIR